jgi:dienelactone hydrolase
MEKKYYFEKTEQNSAYRRNYLNDMLECSSEKKKIADQKRHEFIKPEKLFANRNFYLNEFVKMLGFPLVQNRTPVSLYEKILIKKDGNVNIYRMVFIILGHIRFYGIFFEQDKSNDQTPFIICLHGGGGTPEVVSSIYDSGNYNDMARRLTDKGSSVFAPQLLLWHNEQFGGEAFDRKEIDGKFKQLDSSVTALETYLISSVLDYFIKENPNIKEHIGVCGMSYGGMYALMLSAYDERICACLSSSFFNDRFIYSWSDWSYKGSAYTFSDAEVCALICPKPLCISIGKADSMFGSEFAENPAQEVKEYYKYLNKNENFVFYIFDGNHEFDKSDRGIDFLLKNLQK